MSGWRDELKDLAAAGERQASPPEPSDVRRRVRRRRVARTAVPVAATVAVLAAGAILVPQLFRQPVAGPPEQAAEVCGMPVQEAAAATFDAGQAVGPGEGFAEVIAGANRVVEHGAGFAIGVGVKYGASGVAEFALVPTASENYVAAWLVDDGEVVGLLEPEFVTAPEGNVQPGTEVWLDGSYVPQSCDGGPAAVGEYTIVAAVSLTPVLDGNHDPGTTTAVLSEPIPLRIGEADPLAGLGACGSAWPDGVVETTDGYALGLRLDTDAAGARLEGDTVELVVTARNVGTQQLEGWTGYPYVVLVADGVVVGVTGATSGEGLEASLAPGASLDYDGFASVSECGDVAPAAGTYQVYAIMSFFFESPAGQDGPDGTRTDVTAVGGPWELTIG